MKRALALATFLTTPAMAGGPVWEDMIADTEPGVQILGAIFACANAVTDPNSVGPVFVEAGWDSIEGEDGTMAYQAQYASVMFWQVPGFCRLDTSFATQGMASFLAAFEIVPTGTDADGCTQFDIPDSGVVATLTGGGNDPQCNSTTESALLFTAAP